MNDARDVLNSVSFQFINFFITCLFVLFTLFSPFFSVNHNNFFFMKVKSFHTMFS